MNIGKWVLVKYNNKLIKGMVINFTEEDLEIKLEDNTIICRKFWEVGKINEE
jgi:hypothetical protein